MVGLEQLDLDVGADGEERLLGAGGGGIAEVLGVGLLIGAGHADGGLGHAEEVRVSLRGGVDVVYEDADLGDDVGSEPGFCHGDTSLSGRIWVLGVV